MEVALRVGVLFYGTIDCTVTAPVALIGTLEDRFPGLALSISCYPTEDTALGT